jgi:ornithine lipid ester-linked acyl 2-hydroxylase
MLRNLPARVLFRTLMAAERMNRRHSLLGDQPFFASSDLPWPRLLEARAPEIRAELDALLKDVQKLPSFQEISPEQAMLTSDAGWKTFFFKGYGVEFPRNMQRCPRTAEALALIPGMKTAFFSILAPGKVLPEHRGPYNGVLRYHLGLRVPASDETCAIRVNGIVKNWSEGESLVFDDTFMHEAWNRTPHWRIVLFVDFLRPLPLVPRLVNKLMMAVMQRTAFVKVAVKNQARWEDGFYT